MTQYSIQVKNFSKSFGRLTAVKNLSFEIQEGEVFAFLGTNGSGKSTTIRCLLKIYRAYNGNLLINGKEYSEKLNNIIGYLPEERGLYRDTKVVDILSYTARLRGIPKSEAFERSIDYLKKVDLFDHKDKKTSQLSSGMQQKVQLGIALIHKPKILILDEPFKGLDPVNRQLFIDMFLEQASNGVTILYSTHLIDDAQKMSDRLLIIHKGERIEYGTTNEVRQRHGTNNLFITFAGEKPKKNNKFYKSIISNNTAEIIPKKQQNTNEIIKELINNGTQILELKIDYPSLNKIFIDITSKNEK